MRMILPNLAFIGKAGAGKSTCAEFLVKHHGYERLSFAAPLKAGCGTSTDREVLQRVGVGVRELHADFWVNLLLTDIRHRAAYIQAATDYTVTSDEIRFVVDDCRFPNEAAALRREGFKFVEVRAMRNDRVVRLRSNGKLTDEAQLEHESETALDGFVPDYVLRNDDTPAKLHHELVEILNRERR